MDSADRQVLAAASDWLGAGHRVALATVARTWGSSPRPPGSWAVLRDDGAIVGSVSGGCIEEDLLRRVREGGPSGTLPQVLSFGATPEEAARFALPCGGTVQLVVEPNPELGQLRSLGQRLAAGVTTARRLDLASGTVKLADAARNTPLAWDGRQLTTIHGPRLRLLIIGAVQTATYLASMALALDYEVTVCEPRAEYRDTWRVDGVHLLADMPDDAVAALKPDAGTAIVALTHDPRLDDLALLEALRSSAFYVGALGSRLNAEKRRRRMLEHLGMTQAEIERLRTPVGLAIGSRTPAEIAVSILAEMTAVNNGTEALPRATATISETPVHLRSAP